MPWLFRHLAILALAALSAAPAFAQESIWHYAPYEMRVWLAMAPAAELNAAMEERILRGLRERAEATALAPWTLSAEPAPEELHGSLLAGLEWMTVERLAPGEKPEEPAPPLPSTAALSTGSGASSEPPATLLPAESAAEEATPASPPPDYSSVLEAHDKLLLVRIAPDRGGFLIEVRELDCRTRQWSETLVRRAAHASLLPLETFQAIEAVFRPVARIERAKGNSATVRLRAGGLVEDEQSPAHVADNSVLIPVVRFNDRYGKPRPNGVQIAPWTFLTCQERVGPGRFECELTAGAATPLTGRTSSRVDKYGLLARPRSDKTDVVILAQPVRREDPDQKEPLAGYEVHERLPAAEELTFVGRTDWRGLVEIPKADRPLRVLYVKNGGRVLSKFPVVPGLEPRLEVRVMNDDRRLEVEGFVTGIQSRVMDLVVAREVLALRIRKRIEEKKLDEAAALMNDLRTLPDREQVQAELNREEAQYRLLPVDRRTKSYIDKLFSDARALISKFLDPGLIDKVDQELRQARSG
jgi:hypothetical protein